MATITGSATGTTNWSTIPFDPVNFEADIDTFASRMTTAINEFASGFFDVMIATPTFIKVVVASGTLDLTGTGFNSNPIITNVKLTRRDEFDQIQTLSMNCVIDGFGNETVSRITTVTRPPDGIGVISIEAVNGSFLLNPNGDFLGGTATSLSYTSGIFKKTITGNLSVSSSGDISGNINSLQIVNLTTVPPTDTITVTGISLPFDATLASITNADELLSVIGGQLGSNDTITYTNNSAVGLTFNSGGGNDAITVSGPHGDTLSGGEGNDTLNGGLGTDSMTGGLGNDTFVLNTAADIVVENADEGTDTLRLVINTPANFSMAGFDNVENAVVTGTGAVDVTGNDIGNAITGNSAANTLTGLGGNDTLLGGGGGDHLDGGGGDDDVILLGSVAQYVAGETIDGGDGLNDTLRYTGAVAATLNLGADVFNLEVVEIANAAGVATGIAAINVNASNVAGNGLTLRGNSGNNQLTGTGQNDSILGGAGNDILVGGTGVDTLTGGAGNDAVLIASAADHAGGEQVTGDLGIDVIRFTSTLGGDALLLTSTVAVEGVVIGTAAGITTGTTALHVDASNVATNGLAITGNNGANAILGTGMNDLISSNGGDDSLDGGLGNDTIAGGAGNDILAGGTGTDRLLGGMGNDTYENVVAGSTAVVEALAAGTDTVRSNFTYALGANVENLTLTGVGDANGTGNTLNNTIVADSGFNVLDGGAGNDTISGGAGQDSVTGGAGNDLVTMLVTAGDVDAADGGAMGSDTLALTGVVGGTGQVTVDLAVAGGDQVTFEADVLVQSNFENVDAAGIGSTLVATGSAGANLIVGSDGNDTLNGAGGNDTLTGSAGNDILLGSTGNDTFLYTAGGHFALDFVNGEGDTDVIRFTSIDDDDQLTLDANVDGIEQVVIGSAAGIITGTTALHVSAAAVDGAGTLGLAITGNNGSNSIIGTSRNDTISGNGGNDTLEGGDGTDKLMGGLGNDVYAEFVAGMDVVSEGLNAGIDTIETLSSGYALGTNLDNLLLLGTADISASGNALNNVLTGNTGINVLNGSAGNDTLIGGEARDSITGGTGNDHVTMLVAITNLDSIDAGVGGVDTLLLSGADAGVVVVNLAVSGDQVTFTGDDLVQSNFENVDGSGLGAGSSLDVTGTFLANIITGSAAGDVMSGGLGNDTYVIQNAGDQVNESIGGGVDTVVHEAVPTDHVLANHVENLTVLLFLGSEGVSATGNDLNNIIRDNSDYASGGILLRGLAGNDLLIGGAGLHELSGGTGKDTLMGGAGNDLYSLSLPDLDLGDVLVEAANQGDDLVNLNGGGGSVNFAFILPTNVDRAVLLNGSGAGTVTGNVLDNSISSLSWGGTAVLSGGAGNDTLSGGAGNDTLSGGAGNDTLSGGAGNDTLVGSTGVDNLRGEDGADVFLYGAPTDLGANETVDGGGNIDTLRFTSTVAGTTLVISSTVMVETVAIASAAGLANGTTALNVNAAAAPNALTILGNNGANTITSTAFGDTLDGRGGNDTYLVNGSDDTVAETLAGAAGGVDTVRSTAASFTLGANVENLVLLPGALDGTGNATANVITGNAGNNILDGGGGNDRLTGGLGNDTYVVDAPLDVVTEGLNGGSDTVQSFISYSIALLPHLEHVTLMGDANINATGNAQPNTLIGNTSNNILNGGAGADSMAGGPGDDLYLQDSALDVLTELLGEGTDTARLFYNVTTLTEVDLNDPAYDNIENLEAAGLGQWNLHGDSGDNVLNANGFLNYLDGGAGNDTLVGSAGTSLVARQTNFVGGAGNDSYVMLKGWGGSGHTFNLIHDFFEGDKILLDRSFYTALPLGPLDPNAFASGAGVTTAQDASDRIIYDTSTSDAYYDPDGTGPAARVAVFDGYNPFLYVLVASDFEVIP